MDIQRYHLDYCELSGLSTIITTENGEYVLYDDHLEQAQSLQAERDKLREALEETNAALYGCIGVNPELEGMANIAHAMKLAKQALGGE